MSSSQAAAFRRNIGVFANLPANCSVGIGCYPLFISCAAPLELQDFCGDDDVAS
jgi:hypothetical protein